MNICLYVKSHIFKSTDAAAELAKKNDKHRGYAESLIKEKISRIENSTSEIDIKKRDKYTRHLNSLPRGAQLPEHSNTCLLYIKSHLFNSTDAAVKLANKDSKHESFATNLISSKIKKCHRKNEINFLKLEKYDKLLTPPHTGSQRNHVCGPYTPSNKEKWDASLHELASILEKKKITSETPEVKAMPEVKVINDAMHAPEQISIMKELTLEACNNVLSSQDVNMPQVRRITTNLTYFSGLNNQKAALEAKGFLNKTVSNDNDTFQSYGSEDTYSNETLLMVKEHVEEIKNWLNKMSA